MDPETRMVLPKLKSMAYKFHVSLSSIKRATVDLRAYRDIEVKYVKKHPAACVYTVYYKILSTP